METLTFGWIGIALAGGAYPVAQILLDVGMPPLPNRIVDAVMLSVVGFFVGFVYSGLAATVMVAA
ncbi:MAG TPA: hypothetical protein VF175_05785, partial [Lacipirellula sp.]